MPEVSPSAVRLRLAVFDMDDVLCGYEIPARVARLAALSGRSPETIHAALWESGFMDEADRGRWDAAGTLAEFGRRIGHPITLDEWVEARRIAMPPFTDVLALLERVKRRATIALLSNNDPLVELTLPRLFPELPALFGEHLYVSSRFGVSKPDPAVYRACCAAAGVAPEEAFFTDDKEENVAGAMQAGMIGHVFQNAEGLERALTKAGLL